MKRYRRVFGRDDTRLTLTDKAEEFYYGTDPIRIYEYRDRDEDEDGYMHTTYMYTYSMCGDPESRMMTEGELNAELEALHDVPADDGDWQDDDRYE